MSRTVRTRRLLAILLCVAAGAAGCGGGNAHAPVVRAWVVGRPGPDFDPQGPPDPTRWAIERLLSHGLVDEDSTGRIVPAAARGIAASADSLTWTFRLDPALAFADGTPCHSDDLRDALIAGLGREDHSTKAWLLSAVRGVDQVRAGKPMPALGIESPDPHTLVLHLARADRQLLQKLALPGVSAPWRARHASDPHTWANMVGLGPWRVSREEQGRRLVLARGRSGWSGPALADAPDSVVVKFVIGGARALQQLRSGAADLLWPVPPGVSADRIPAGYVMMDRQATPRRELLLVMRADRPPTSKLPARQALAHALNRDEVVHGLDFAREGGTWLPGAPPFEFPSLSGETVQSWLDRGGFGRSFHAVMAYDADGPAADAAPLVQGEWARLNIYVDLDGQRGARLTKEMLDGRAHILLVETQPLFDDLAAALAPLVMPMRGGPVGAWRGGWRTRDLDPWLRPARGATPPDPALAQGRIAESGVALPITGLGWRWVAREQGPQTAFHPHFGPQLATPAAR
jgi:ABC-type transport system substrate-binding protein